MATAEKVNKKKIGGSKSKGPAPSIAVSKNKEDNGPRNADSKSGSVPSVKEALSEEQHETLEKGTAEESKSEKEAQQPPVPPTSSIEQRPPSAASTRPTSARPTRPPSAASRSTPMISPLPSTSQERPDSGRSQKSKASLAPMGSSVSLKSREAWIQGDGNHPTRPTSAISNTSNRGGINPVTNASIGMETNTSPMPGKSGMGSGLFRSNNTVHPQEAGPLASSSYTNQRTDSEEPDNQVTVLAPAEVNESHAYVPYIYARDSIVKIMQDMKNMKSTHIRIVHDIEDNFRAIEDETQAQFNLFVTNLRDQYSIKVKTFRQVIEVHRLELQQKEQYWDEVLMSLSYRNKNLLQDKKILLIQNKLEFDRLEDEKNKRLQSLQKQLDEGNAKHAAFKKEMEQLHEGNMVHIKTQHDEEKKVVADALEIEKQENGNLRKEIEELNRKLTHSIASTATEQVSAEPVVVVAEMTQEERQRMKEERERMDAERQTMSNDRMEIEKERGTFAVERNKFQEERILIHEDLSKSLKDKEAWRVKYDALKAQLGDLADMKAKYDALSAQYTAISTLAVASAVENKDKTDEKIGKTQEDKDLMVEEKRQMDHDIEQWTEKFKRTNGRDPEAKDKPDSIKELEISSTEAGNMVASLDTQINTLQSLKNGEVPERPTVIAVPIDIREPEVHTVEVKVPDPEVLASLQAAQAEVDKLKSDLAASKADTSTKQGEISNLEAELADVKAQISMLEAKISGLEEQNTYLGQKLVAGAVGATAGAAVADVDSEALKAEYEARLKDAEKARKSVEKELKKLKKAKAKPVSSDEAERIKKLLNITVREVREVNSHAEKAANLVDEKLKLMKTHKDRINEENEMKKKQYESWVSEWTEKNGQAPTPEDIYGDHKGKKLSVEYEESYTHVGDHNLTVQVLEMIATGAIPETFTPKTQEVVHGIAASTAVTQETEQLEGKLEDLQDQLDELSGVNEQLLNEKTDLEEEMSSLKAKLALGVAESSDDDLEELSGQISELQQQVDEADARLVEETSAHTMTKDELEAILAQLEALQTELEAEKTSSSAVLEAATTKLNAEISNLQQKLATTEKEVEELDKARLANIPVDAQKEIKSLKAKLATADKDKDANVKVKVGLEADIKQLNVKIASLEKTSSTQKAASSDGEQKFKQKMAEKDKEIKEITSKFEKKEKDRAKQEEKKIAALDKKIQQLEITAASAGSAAPVGKGKAEKSTVDKAAQEKLRESQRELKDAQNKIKHLENELKAAQKGGGGGVEEAREKKKQEKILKELEKKLEMLSKKNEKNEQNLKKQSEELDNANKDVASQTKEISLLKSELDGLGVAAAEGVESAAKVKELEVDVKKLNEENKLLTENFNSERVLRKKYYNMVEDMKGKIRVYCRVRPMSSSEISRGNHSICKSPDEYTIAVDSSRGIKEFQFDTIFMPDHSQDKVFEDTNNLIQSAIDGYNVCIFAYGQTGSGKTYTIIGGSGNPGIAPRAFTRIYELAEEIKAKFTTKIQVYMLELYNDKLLDLFVKHNAGEEKLEIKKDRKGMVVVQGAEVRTAKNAQELWTLFDEGSKTRHVASTKMNAESSRSHLVVGITIECTNKMSGQVSKGKLSLVDLAGSERAAKTDATAEQLKEAMSINKSLSALGDVISALSSEQSFIPYRNNKLTMLMQDSLGGNAKTLMFVNVSPADYNADETVTSLTYAARVKLITNDASKNAENKEINRLKGIIAKLKSGEAIEEEAEPQDE